MSIVSKLTLLLFHAQTHCHVACTHPPSSSPPPTHTQTHTCSGLLTGKFSRGETPSPDSSRLGWVEEKKQSRANQSHPSLSEYAEKESYWQLMDAMKKIANKHGKLDLHLEFPPLCEGKRTLHCGCMQHHVLCSFPPSPTPLCALFSP